MSFDDLYWYSLARARSVRPTVAVIGGGASGTLAAIHLLRRSEPLQLVVVEERRRLGRGVAYGTTCDEHLLNVPAAGMSAYPDDPGHFLRWARTRRPDTDATSFLPRRLYGEYLEACLDHEARHAAERVTITAVGGRVTAVTPGQSGATVRLRGGASFRADQVVLAMGHSVGARAAPAAGPVRDAWEPGALAGLPAGRAVVIIGTGLTAVDVILSLDAAGFDGPVHALSRRGLLPQAHRPGLLPGTAGHQDGDLRRATPLTGPERAAAGWTARSLLAAVRAEVGMVEAMGGDWRGVVDGLRPHTQALWASLPEPERSRLYRHALRYWEVHRHRMTPEVADRIGALRRSGRLHVTAGRVISVTPARGGAEVLIHRWGTAGGGGAGQGRHRFPDRADVDGPGSEGPDRAGGPARFVIRAGAVIRATGPTESLAGARDPLLDGLFRSGHARPGPLGLGLDVDGDGRLIGDDGEPSAVLWAIGPLRRGALLETTAVPEIRVQAAALARLLPSPTAEIDPALALEEAR